MLVSPSLHNRFKQVNVCYFGTHFLGSQIKPSRRCWNACFIWVLLLCPPLIHSIAKCKMRWFLAILRNFFHSSLLYTLSFQPFPPTSLPFSSASSSHLFLGLPPCLVSKFIYNNFLGILFSSILCTCPNQCNLFNVFVSVIVGFLCFVWVISTTARKKLHHT